MLFTTLFCNILSLLMKSEMSICHLINLHYCTATGSRIVICINFKLISINKVNMRFPFPGVVHLRDGDQFDGLTLQNKKTHMLFTQQKWKAFSYSISWHANGEFNQKTIKDNVIHTFKKQINLKRIRTCCRMRDVWENLFWWSLTNCCDACTTEGSGKPNTGYTFTGQVFALDKQI